MASLSAIQLLQRCKLKMQTPFYQNFIVGILLGLTAGLYVALNLLGAGGGKPNSASTINTANAILCAFYAVSAFCGGTVLNKIGPSWTAFVSSAPGQPPLFEWDLEVADYAKMHSSVLLVISFISEASGILTSMLSQLSLS